ncbi:tetraacyldisaccharide 4'-kinase [Desulfovibrio mangrovi]|uniref:tetraacyldisaccharide 4'-kinase n=1 Tax=Desulfovibrio mangrovi TaxID=2976983 RepID=UPI0022466523|nr:tetraacyldisaccharide 4'-kinase [Desulfovibrio mangrovi]UZP68868.1 tetraacyldisaccharide 4'-kinase [Desulfovibrio mangrovi]
MALRCTLPETFEKAQRVLRPLLWPFGKAYSAVMAVRRRRYEQGGAKVFSPSVPTVSVGNIGWGGSGKTPIVDWLLDWSAQEGHQAVVLTRGYKATPPALPYVVGAASSAAEAGDEPLMLARQHPQARIVVDPVRRRSGAWAEANLAPDIFVMDDGFQHLAVRRDTDLVLLRPDDLRSEWDRVIPSGSWREGACALSRASAFLIKCTPEEFADLLPDVKKRLGHLGVPVFSFSLQPVGVQSVTEDEVLSSAGLIARNGYVLFSGVGVPAQVEQTVASYVGVPPLRYHVFPDHYGYTREDILNMAEEGVPLLCTPKDAVKIAGLGLAGVPVWTLVLKTVFGPAWNTPDTFSEWWGNRWQAMQSARGI